MTQRKAISNVYAYIKECKIAPISTHKIDLNKQDFFHEYLRDNLYKYPKINPSIVLKNDLLYDVGNQKPHANITSFITTGSFENIDNTIQTISRSIVMGGKTCIENYKQHHGNNSKIIESIMELLENTVD